jgi:hypothetical protein
MASAYDEIKKALVMLRHGEPITEQSRLELGRLRKSLEQQLAKAELLKDDLLPSMVELHRSVSKESLATRTVSES